MGPRRTARRPGPELPPAASPWGRCYPTGIGQTHAATWHHPVMTIDTERRAAAQELAAWTSALDLGDVPAEVRVVAREHILDTLGCGLAALGVGEGIAGLAVAADAGAGPASAIGRSERVP